MYSGTSLDIKKIIALLHNSLLVCYKVYWSDAECLCTQAEGMMKPMKTLVGLLIQHHVERILQKIKLVVPNCQPLLLRENYTEIKV